MAASLKTTSTAPWADDAKFGANAFLSIRLALALLVICSHSYVLTLGQNARDPLTRINASESLGALAVDMFLAVSGFLVTRSWDNSGTTRVFLTKRVLRIFPGFIVLWLVQAFLIAPWASGRSVSEYTARQYGLMSLEIIDLVGYGYPYGGLFDHFPDNPHPHAMNSSLWTIRYEFICYLFLAALGSVNRKVPVVAAAFMVTLAVYITGWTIPWNRFLTAGLGDGAYWPRLLTFFLAGVLFYRLRSHLPHSHLVAVGCVVALAASVFLPTIFRLVLPTCGVYLLFWIAYCVVFSALRRVKADYSYGTYLYAFPIQQSLILWARPMLDFSPYSLTLVAGVLSVIVGALSWHFVERPCLKLKP